MTASPSARADALLTGCAKPYTRLGSSSGIDKHACIGSVQIGELGLSGDEQGDPRVHGGPDKAVHHYPFEHYAQWQDDLGPLPLLQTPGRSARTSARMDWTRAMCASATNSHWAMRHLNALLFGRVLDPAELEPALQLPLVPPWRKLVERRLQQCVVEDWSRRIDGPALDASH